MLREYNVHDGETIFDIAINTYGSTDYVYKLIADNPVITSIDFDFSLYPGTILLWDPDFKIIQAPDLTSADTAPASTLASYTALDGQSIFDICLQTYGDLNLLYKLMQDNKIDNTNSTMLKGSVFIFDTLLIKDNSLKDDDYHYATLSI
ncbi:hypothetical protein UFOVP1596_11 [uncultured Caudovirales phage]|uniref:LysM domain-containing protein n=1 Tax=uncultured Caudovirales phage TaxID=2100421 RepID=A0A6J5SUM2_9CAUD|nr:hypothetical protein UFOVP1596_11 [uncultured Caudovirales phage]